MNSLTYIFGELAQGYSQYPEDSFSNLFKDIYAQCVAPSQLIIHRDDNMMYYVYVRKLDKNKYIGFCFSVNGYYLTHILQLISLFETQIEEMANAGVIINLTQDGEITSSLSSLSKEEEEVLAVLNSLQTKIDRIKGDKKLPPIDYTVSIASKIIFKGTDSLTKIIDASYRFGYTVILKEEDYDTVRLNSYKSILRNLNADKNALIKENASLRENNKKIKRQKEQFRKVVMLIIILIACTIGLYLLYLNLNDTQSKLDSARTTITNKESIIKDKNGRISRLRDSITNLEKDVSRESSARNKAESSLHSICSYAPFTVTRSSVSSSQFSFDYYSVEEKNVTVTLKAINDRTGSVISNIHNLTIYKGSGSKQLYFDRSLNGSEYYYVVLMYEGRIIAGRYW